MGRRPQRAARVNGGPASADRRPPRERSPCPASARRRIATTRPPVDPWAAVGPSTPRRRLPCTAPTPEWWSSVLHPLEQANREISEHDVQGNLPLEVLGRHE